MSVVIVSYEQAKRFVTENGYDAWFLFLKSQFPDKDLYTISKDWYENKSYICKARGTKGDLIVSWKS